MLNKRGDGVLTGPAGPFTSTVRNGGHVRNGYVVEEANKSLSICSLPCRSSNTPTSWR
jgi:hypothetical protein